MCQEYMYILLLKMILLRYQCLRYRASTVLIILYVFLLVQIYVFCGHLCLSYAVAFVVSLTFESPMMGLEKALLGRGKNS